MYAVEVRARAVIDSEIFLGQNSVKHISPIYLDL